MKNHILFFPFAFILFLTASCTKVIDLKLGNDTGKLVIEGKITNATGLQTIKLTTNVPFTNTNVYPPVTGAAVSVTDQSGKNYLFTETTEGTYSNTQLTGVPGNTYFMTVTTGGKTYKASSVMPGVVRLDSLTAKKSTFNSSDNQRQITVHYTDPAATANQYHFLMYVNNVEVKSVFADNDEFNNGRTVSLDLREQDIDVYPGDTVTVEMQCVDPAIYTYWLALMQQSGNGPGGSVTPANPPNNITPAALGYFSAHTVQTATIIVK